MLVHDVPVGQQTGAGGMLQTCAGSQQETPENPKTQVVPLGQHMRVLPSVQHCSPVSQHVLEVLLAQQNVPSSQQYVPKVGSTHTRSLAQQNPVEKPVWIHFEPGLQHKRFPKLSKQFRSDGQQGFTFPGS
jgi:hypothetical protein